MNSAQTTTNLSYVRVFRLGAALAVAWAVFFVFGRTVPAAAALYPLANADHPYWQPAHALLLYVATPAALLASFVVVLTPGLLLVLLFGSARVPGEWLVKALALNVPALGVGNGIILMVTDRPLTRETFLFLVALLSLIAFAALGWRIRQGSRRPWPLATSHARAMLISMAVAPAILFVALAPKFLWENFNGDGAHSFEAARLLLTRPFPFFDPAAGAISKWPGVTSMLFAYPTSWFIQLFGPLEVSARAPYLLYLTGVFAGICALSTKRERALREMDFALIWLGLAAYTVVAAFSVTYSPYSADIALPSAQDTLLVVWFLGFALACASGWRAWTVCFTALCYLTLPNGLVLIGFWWLAMALLWRPVPGRTLALVASAAIGCVMLGVVLPKLLQAAGAVAPGGELAVGGLVERFNWLQLSDIKRSLYLLLPCGILPAISLFVWQRQDVLSRTVTSVALAYFAFTYVQAFASLHYYIPSMLLPLVVFWRNTWVAPARRGVLLTGAAVSALLAIWVSLPENAAPYTTARQIGSDIQDRVGGYRDSSAEQLRSSFLLTAVFPNDWDPAVPRRALGGSPLVWNYYAHASPRTPANYILQRASMSAPADATQAANDSDFVLFIRDTALWRAQRALRPPTPAGAKVYQVSRAVLFRSGSGEDGFRVVNLRRLLRKIQAD